VTRFIQSSAENDILAQVEWYAERELPDVARRFFVAAYEAIDGLAAMPLAGAPKHLDNPRLEGLRTWPVKGFDLFRVYYLARPDLLTVIRVLHERRDIRGILEDWQS
jgi:toxin ParE1/3/4